MFASSAIRFGIFCINCIKTLLSLYRGTERERGSCLGDLKEVFLHLPFVQMMRNLYLAWKLHKLGFGSEDFKAKDSAEVEAILKEVGLAGQYESFLESGPQSITQCVIILSTGRITRTQIVSIAISVASLTWGGGRSFFIQRDSATSDPDPPAKMIITRVFFYLLLMTLNSLIMWTFIGGFLGIFTAPALTLNFCVTYGILTLAAKMTEADPVLDAEAGQHPDSDLREDKNKSETVDGWMEMKMWKADEDEDEEEEEPEEEEKKKSKKDQILGEDTTVNKKREKEYFRLKAAIFGLWIPSVVGRQNNVFIISALTNLVMKMVILGIAVGVALSGNQGAVHKNPFLLWCHREGDGTSLEEGGNIRSCSFSNNSCFQFNTDANSTGNEERILQKRRVCGTPGEEVLFFWSLFVALLASNVISAASTWMLHKISDYEELFHVSKKWLGIVKTEPIVHRSLLRKAVESDDVELLADITKGKKLKMSEKINRPLPDGETVLHISTSRGKTKSTHLLLQAGAVFLQNRKGELPNLANLLDDESLSKTEEVKEILHMIVNQARIEDRRKEEVCELFVRNSDLRLIQSLNERDKKTVEDWDWTGTGTGTGLVHQITNQKLSGALVEWFKSDERKEEKREQVITLMGTHTGGTLLALDSITGAEKVEALAALKEWNMVGDNPTCKY